MHQDELRRMIHRSMNDEGFLDRLMVAPADALKEFDLTEAECEVVATGDEIAFNEMLGIGNRTAHINANQYHHSQHKGIAGQKPDLLPRIESE